MKLLILLLFSIILIGVIPITYGLSHPEPAIYIVNTIQDIPPLSGTNIGEDFKMIWGIENRGNVDVDNVFIRGTLKSGVTFVSSSSSNCTYDTSTRIIDCLVPGTIAPFQGIIIHNFILTVDVAGTWINTAGVCGNYLGVDYCDFDDSFIVIDAVEPLLITCSVGFEEANGVCVSIIQPINVTALNERIVSLENKNQEQDVIISQLENRIIALESIPIDLTNIENRVTTLELVPDPEPVDLTPLENRLTILEQAWLSFQTSWRNVFE